MIVNYRKFRVRVCDRFVSEIDLRDKNSSEADILVFESRKVHLLRIECWIPVVL